VLPEVRIMGVARRRQQPPATNAAGAPTASSPGAPSSSATATSSGSNTESFSGNADYFWKNFTFSAGFDREESDFFNLFRATSYGIFDYASVADFVADRPAAFSRAFYVQGTPAADRRVVLQHRPVPASRNGRSTRASR
jgi:hypothetical protein